MLRNPLEFASLSLLLPLYICVLVAYVGCYDFDDDVLNNFECFRTFAALPMMKLASEALDAFESLLLDELSLLLSCCLWEFLYVLGIVA